MFSREAPHTAQSEMIKDLVERRNARAERAYAIPQAPQQAWGTTRGVPQSQEASFELARPETLRERHAPKRPVTHKRPSRRAVTLLFALAVVIAVGFSCLSSSGILNVSSISSAIGSSLTGSASGEWPSTPRSEWSQDVMPALYQKDPEWSGTPYGEGSFGENGCGPMCMAMVYIYLTGDTACSPAGIADYATRAGFAGPSGTDWSFMTEGAEHLGIRSGEISLDEALIRECLASGYPIICAMGPGDFTTEGHFIVLAGVDEYGSFIVRDPNSVERTARTWSFDTLSSQCRNLWVFSL